jgi:hypothetical protein
MRFKLASLLIVATFSSCVVAPFKPANPPKPITGGDIWDGYRSDGKSYPAHSVRQYLKTRPDTESDATASETWSYLGALPSLAGVTLIAYNAFKTDRESNTGLWVGVGLAVAGIVCGKISDRYLVSAVDTYNQSLMSKPSAELQVAPVLVPTAGSPTPAAGLALSLSLN